MNFQNIGTLLSLDFGKTSIQLEKCINLEFADITIVVIGLYGEGLREKESRRK